MYSITDLKVGTKVIIEGDPYVVTFSQHSKQGRSGAVMRTKLKNLITAGTIDKTFQGSDKIEPAELSHKSAQFLYSDDENAFFMDNTNFEQFELPVAQLADQIGYLAENSAIEILYFQDPSTPLGAGKPISLELPIKMTFEVTDAPPGIKGNSAGTVTKMATISTGGQVAVPLFIKAGDKIVIDTRTNSYIERAN
ncbi:MAG: elongation factor P [Candidatus Berkelbacteria bacterium]|nr:elongation factor P [Candidatus Berkelbacteria bacterium]